MLTNVFTRCDTACPAQPGLEPLATVGRNWIIKIIIITITKDDSDEDDDGNGEVDGWYPAQVSSPTLPICDRLPIPPLSLSPCTYILSLWWLCCHDDDDGDNNDDATTCMQAWQRQLFPVKVTRSPVGKGRLHRAHVKQAWGGKHISCQTRKECEKIKVNVENCHLVKSISKSADHLSFDKEVAFRALCPKICLKCQLLW